MTWKGSKDTYFSGKREGLGEDGGVLRKGKIKKKGFICDEKISLIQKVLKTNSQRERQAIEFG